MSDRARVEGWFRSGALLRPDANVPNTVDLARALASIAGAEGIELGKGAAAARDAIGENDHLVFALIDGLGMNLIESLPAGWFLREHVAMELRAVFPATTATALTALATGCWPGQHAATGWWTYLPERKLTSTILLFIERFGGRPLDEFGATIEEVYPQPSLMPSYTRATQALLPHGLTTTAFSRYVAGGTVVRGYDKLSDGVDRIIDRITSASGPTYTYFYYPTVDGLEHALGWQALEVRRELLHVERELARLAKAIAGPGRLAISADHGLMDVADADKRYIGERDELLDSLVVPPSGEPRVPYFHVRPGEHERFASQFRERFGEDFALLSIDEADDLHLFGPEPMYATARARIGDFVGVTSSANALILGAPDGPPDPMRGFHGGMTPAEMRIPLIVA
jgi:hypothetical protein